MILFIENNKDMSNFAFICPENAFDVVLAMSIPKTGKEEQGGANLGEERGDGRGNGMSGKVS